MSTDRPAANGSNAPPPIRRNHLHAGAPLQWLKLGWRDFASAPRIGLFHGACFATMGALLVLVFRHAPLYVLGAKVLTRAPEAGIWLELTARLLGNLVPESWL